VLCLGCALAGSAPANAWFTNGHARVAEASVERLPDRVPEFFREGAAAVAHAAVDPDLEKARALVELRAAESPEHYLDRERMPGAELPRSRYAFLDSIRDAGFSAVEVGLLPYAILEDTQRLMLAFAEYRRWPDDPYVQRRALVHAGNLAHYSADLCQPLHTTIHHDGRAKEDGSSPFSGIHRRVDGLFEQGIASVEVGTPAAFEDIYRAIVREFDASHALVDRVYELEELLLAMDAESEPPAEIVDFAADRWRASVRFTASLFLYAWDRSVEIELPSWHDRPDLDDSGGASESPAEGVG